MLLVFPENYLEESEGYRQRDAEEMSKYRDEFLALDKELSARDSKVRASQEREESLDGQREV